MAHTPAGGDRLVAQHTYGGASHWPLARRDRDNWEALHQDAVDRSTDLPSSLLAWLEDQLEREVGNKE